MKIYCTCVHKKQTDTYITSTYIPILYNVVSIPHFCTEQGYFVSHIVQEEKKEPKNQSHVLYSIG